MAGKSVTIFTNFADSPQAYSLNRIVQCQLKMLLSHGYSVKVIVADGFVPEEIYAHKQVEIVYIPNVPVHNEVKKDETFEKDVDAIYRGLKEALLDSQVVITHDIVYQPACLKHNFAARKLADEMPQLRWLHWIHSATSPQTLTNLKPHFEDAYIQMIEKPFPNSFYIFFNHYSVPRIAKNFHVPQEMVRVVHHPSDLKEIYAMSESVWSFVHKKHIYDADAIAVYPVRLDRGKQVEYVIKTMALLKEFRLSIKVVVVDFHSTGGDKLIYRDELKNVAIDYGLTFDELLFTSEGRPEWEVEVPYEDTLALMRIANVFIMPSVSESYSLITQEAGLNKCAMVLNQDFPPFRDIFGPHATYKKYSSRWDVMADVAEADGSTDTKYGPDSAASEERENHEKKYHRGTAALLAEQLNNTDNLAMSIFLRKYRNLDYIFEHEMEPLFYGK